MRRLLAPLVLLLGSGALVSVPAGSYGATSCPAPPSPATAAQQAQAVFTGVLAGPGTTNKSAKPKEFTYPVTVQQSLKGGVNGKATVITQGGACDIGPLKAGTSYLFFVNAHGHGWLAPGTLGTTSQNLSTIVPQVQTALAPPTVTFGKPLTGEPMSFSRAAAPGIALVLIGALGLLFVRRSRRSQA